MADTNLPDATDKVIAGAAATEREEELIVTEPTATRTKLADKVRTGTDKLSTQAADKARGLVGQGLERGSEAIGNVGKLIGDTASGLDERIGKEYGDYARKAASTLDDVSAKLAKKDADELIEDTRAFVKRSPGVALAGAAIVGFALARLVKTGLDSGRDDRD
ncbi:hypothetical protein ABDK56_02005 [Sphingomonas sp. ASV193]|uniref:hypothetical protein n=1 Tax=Sphingomonas sp. ASV193 TaxID=3144405 RepID=UPI0032E85655